MRCAVEKSWGRVLERSVAEVLKECVIKKCCKDVLQRSVVQKC